MPEDCRDSMYSNAYADFIIEYNNNEAELRNYFKEDCVTIINQTFAVVSARRNRESNDFRPRDEQIPYSLTPKCYGLMDSTSMEASGIKQTVDSRVYGYTGLGSLVCIIDTGIDYQSPVFINEDGTSRIVAIWDQTIRDGNAPEPFQYGSLYLKEQIDEALASDTPLSIVPSEDSNGHGTFLASIAAGNEVEVDDFQGAAPEAGIIVVKLKPAKLYLKWLYGIPDESLCYQENDIMAGVAFAINLAREMDRPLSICIGLGTSSGSHEGIGALSRMTSYVSGIPEVFICTAFGNEGGERLHAEGSGTEQVIEFNVGENQQILSMELWGRAPDVYAVGFETPDGTVIERIPPRFNNSERIDFAVGGTVLYVEYTLAQALSGNELIFIWLYRPLPGLWKLRVYAEGTPNPYFNIWMPIRRFVANDTYFLNSSPSITLTDPADAGNVTSVTAYDHLQGSISIQASRGYTADKRVKPDIAAPGVEVFGMGLRGFYERRSGTSVAAAHVAGAAAIIEQWGRENTERRLTGIQIKRYLINGANRMPNEQWPNATWGWGKLDLLQVFEMLRRSV